jgi:ABC-type Fe3+-hydroxamate transport system substrate-binding protein
MMDDLGRTVILPRPPSRLVSLVPSLTELLFALGAGGSVVGVTRFCVRPSATRRIRHVGGTKNPDLELIRALAPELVIANAEENRREDVDTLAAAGIPVYVTFPKTVTGAIGLTRRLAALLAVPDGGHALAERLEAGCRDAVARATPRPRVFCPIWKRPWMSFNEDTFAHDMLALAGGDNVCAAEAMRYPIVDTEGLRQCRPDIVLLPSEPYRFGRRDLDDVHALFAGAPSPPPRVRFVDGQALTWYGSRLDWGLRVLGEALAPDSE